MTINDVLTLARAGFTAQTIQQLMSADAVQAAPAPAAPVTAIPDHAQPVSASFPAAGGVSPTTAADGVSTPQPMGPVTPPAAPVGMDALLPVLSQMQASIDAMRTPQAGSLTGNPAPVTSIDDIILGTVNRGGNQPPAVPNFQNGGLNNGKS